MRSSNDLWEAVGSLAEDETTHVLTKLFTMYEELLAKILKMNKPYSFFAT